MLFIKIVRCRPCIFISVLVLIILRGGISGAEGHVAPLTGASAGKEIVDLGQAPTQPGRTTSEYVKGYITDTGKILASPAIWDGDDWLKAGLVIGATSGLYLADADIRDFAQRNQSSAGDKVFAAGKVLGNPLYAVPSLGLFYLYGHLNQDPKARRTGLLAMESLVISGAVSLGVKLATGRPRPFTGKNATTWNGPGFKNGNTSFPSVHAQTAFSIASVLAEEYGSNPYVPPIAYGLATLTGLSRIYDNKHWASDVFFGAAIGYFVGKAVVSYHNVQSSSALLIMPTVSQKQFGLTAEYRF